MKQQTFKISNQISLQEIENIYEKNLQKILFEFFNLESEWFYNAYDEYKDLDKYLILVYLIQRTLETYNKHFYKVDFEKFYNSPHIEIEKISISEIVKKLLITKETARRKLNQLSVAGILVRKRKNIRINKINFNPRLKKNVYNLSKLSYLFCKNLSRNNNLAFITRAEIEEKILLNYTQYWNIFFKFQIEYLLRCKKLFSSIDAFYIWGLCALNEVMNSKKLNELKKEIFYQQEENFFERVIKLKDSKGLNPTTISELSGIPRATVIRKINFLVKKKFLHKDKQLYKINNNPKSKIFFKLQNSIFAENQKQLRNLLKDILNLLQN